MFSELGRGCTGVFFILSIARTLRKLPYLEMNTVIVTVTGHAKDDSVENNKEERHQRTHQTMQRR